METLFYIVGTAVLGWLAVSLSKRLSPPASAIAVAASSSCKARTEVPVGSVLAPYATALEGTRRPTLAIALTPMAGDDVLVSKVGGRAYWPDGADYPRGENGKPLFLLAQIDFSDAPPLEGYLDSGLLQFFIASDGQYGADFDAGPASGQRNYRVVYWPAPLAVPGPSVPVTSKIRMPMDPGKPRRMRFTAGSETMGAGDVGIDAILGGQAIFELAEEYAERHGLSEDDVSDALYTHLDRTGHKLGGYPYFTQEDPRRVDDPRRLLLQLDSDDAMMWGDAGVANFFIHPDDLARRDFSRVMYNWDCH